MKKVAVMCGVILSITFLFSISALTINIQLALATDSSTLYGIIGNNLVTVDQTTGNATTVGVINATGLLGLTYSPDIDALYSVANATTDPQLIIINRATAQATLVGPIDLEGQDPTFLTFVESLAFNPSDEFVYASAGSVPPYSNMLIRIDSETANASQIVSITGTTENDGDSLIFANGTLYLADAAPDVLFTVNSSTGVATYVGNIDFSNIKLAYDSETQTAYGAATLDRLLITVSLSTGQGTEVGPTHTSEEFEGAFMTAIAFANPQLIPEFPSWVLLTSLMITFLVIVMFPKKAKEAQSFAST